MSTDKKLLALLVISLIAVLASVFLLTMEITSMAEVYVDCRADERPSDVCFAETIR